MLSYRRICDHECISASIHTIAMLQCHWIYPLQSKANVYFYPSRCLHSLPLLPQPWLPQPMWAMPQHHMPQLHMPQLQPHTTQLQLHTMRRRFLPSHLPTSMVELMSMEDTLPRLRLKMNMELSRVRIGCKLLKCLTKICNILVLKLIFPPNFQESTELNFLMVVSRLSPTTLTMTMASLLMSGTRVRPSHMLLNQSIMLQLLPMLPIMLHWLPMVLQLLLMVLHWLPTMLLLPTMPPLLVKLPLSVSEKFFIFIYLFIYRNKALSY